MARHRIDPVTAQDSPDLAPLRASHEADQVEAELKALFMEMLAEFVRPAERVVNTAGTPHLGPFSQIERAVKNEGLALYRRPDESAMRYLFRAWRARNPKRGLHMLRTYLQLLWPNGWTVEQLHQLKAADYPEALSQTPAADKFLTSRVRVAIESPNTTGDDVLAAVPALRSVVPARIVLMFAMLTRVEQQLAFASAMYAGAGFQQLEGDSAGGTEAPIIQVNFKTQIALQAPTQSGTLSVVPIDSIITSTGGANRTRINSSGQRVAANPLRINHTPIGRTNTLKYAKDMTNPGGWLVNTGGWWTNVQSYSITSPVRGAKVTKWTKTVALPPDSVFARCGGSGLSIPAGARSGSLYIYVPSGQSITSYQVKCDWQDIEQGTTASSAVFDAWVRLESTATVAGTRAFLDYCLSVNGTNTSPPLGLVFYTTAPQESHSLSEWIATEATPVTVYDPIGLVNEPTYAQQMTAPNDVANAAWSKAAMTAPSADTLRETATTAYHYIAQLGTITAGAVCVMYAEVKADGRSGLILQIANAGDALQAGFDLNNLATGGYAIPFGAASSIQRAAVALEDGWVGLWVSGIVSPSVTVVGAHIFGIDGSFSSLYLGDPTKGLKVRNLNFGEGRFGTSPVLAPGTATVSAHFAQGAAFAKYFSPVQGTYVIEFRPFALTHNEVYWGIGQSGVFNNSLYLVNSFNRLFLICYSSGVNTIALDIGPLTINGNHRVAISYKAGEVAARMNGGAEFLSAGAMPTGINIEAFLTSPWGGGSGGVAAHMSFWSYTQNNLRSQLASLST